MENDDKFVGTILTRRDVIGADGAVGLMFACSRLEAAGLGIGLIRPAAALDVLASPAVEEGPFFVDVGLNRSNVIGDAKRPSVIGGTPLMLAVAIYDVAGGAAVPLKGAHVDIWHADAAGTYSDERSGGIQSEDTTGQKWLHGYQVTDSGGLVKFATIFPGWYPSRTAHIHIKVRHLSPTGDTHREFTTQLFFDDNFASEVFSRPPYNLGARNRVTNAHDGLFMHQEADGSTAGSHLTLDCKRAKDGKRLTAAFSIGLRV